ncbi:uncharacterized protein N7511_008919 [Penicillium nucicola]|uniref:uncharacterized protein n=1 Tax=Penicillium nucicola TaxID=1850975 RepID=UPI00254541E3|nr:uncharacterized protein N7511_008919 [Penicillium nucicola]KAJ5747223.1 hypothetical protein N7511_008919 [Penicillium nucicola]
MELQGATQHYTTLQIGRSSNRESWPTFASYFLFPSLLLSHPRPQYFVSHSSCIGAFKDRGCFLFSELLVVT